MPLPIPEIICLADRSMMSTPMQRFLAEIKDSGKSAPDIFEFLPS
jgi:hypothetical protein